jgi:HAD superfamily hydrolase (TIGR01450 family)
LEEERWPSRYHEHVVNFRALPGGVQNFLFDIDGVVVRGPRAIDGAAAALDELRSRGYGVAFLTNDNASGPETATARLSRAGIQTDARSVVTAAMIVARFARRWRGSGLRVLLVGSPELRRMLLDEGIDTLAPETFDEDRGTDIVLMARNDAQFNHRTVSMIARALRRERTGGGRVELYAANLDPRQPGQDGHEFMAATGGMVAAVAYVAGRRRPLPIAKPAARAIGIACEILGWRPERTVMVGDQLDSDIQMARKAGVFAILVLSGDTQRAALGRLAPGMTPDLVLASVADVPGLLDSPPRS